jgi:hypothetical protein
MPLPTEVEAFRDPSIWLAKGLTSAALRVYLSWTILRGALLYVLVVP